VDDEERDERDVHLGVIHTIVKRAAVEDESGMQCDLTQRTYPHPFRSVHVYIRYTMLKYLFIPSQALLRRVHLSVPNPNK
jgi:hypothetical protein